MKTAEFNPDNLQLLFQGEDKESLEISEDEVKDFFEHPEMIEEIEGSVNKLDFLARVMDHLVGCEECMKKATEAMEDMKEKGKK